MSTPYRSHTHTHTHKCINRHPQTVNVLILHKEKLQAFFQHRLAWIQIWQKNTPQTQLKHCNPSVNAHCQQTLMRALKINSASFTVLQEREWWTYTVQYTTLSLLSFCLCFSHSLAGHWHPLMLCVSVSASVLRKPISSPPLSAEFSITSITPLLNRKHWDGPSLIWKAVCVLVPSGVTQAVLFRMIYPQCTAAAAVVRCSGPGAESPALGFPCLCKISQTINF